MGIECDSVLQSLSFDLLNLVVSFLSPSEVFRCIAPLSSKLRDFVLSRWYPVHLNLNGQWRWSLHVRTPTALPLPTPPSARQSGKLNEGVEWPHQCDATCPPPLHQSNPWALVAVCFEDHTDVDHLLYEPSEISSPCSASPLTLLRVLAQDTFAFITLRASGPCAHFQIAPWVIRSMHRLSGFRYHHQNSAVNASYFATNRLLLEADASRTDDVLKPSAVQNEHMSLLDLLQILFASSSSLRYFAIDVNPHFSSFLDGPEIPRCPTSLLHHPSIPSNPTVDSSTADGSFELIHWKCWRALLSQCFSIERQTTAFGRLEKLEIGGSYLPASLAILAVLSDTTFPAVQNVCIRGALALGKFGLEFLEGLTLDDQTAAFEMPGVRPLDPMVMPDWLVADLVGALLFAANPFKCLSATTSLPKGRREFWGASLIALFSLARWPNVQELELRIGVGLVERKVWWSLLMCDLFTSKSLEVLDLDCTVESLTCYIPSSRLSSLSPSSSRLISTPTRQIIRLRVFTPQSTGQGRRRFAQPQLVDMLLLMPNRFPALHTVRLSSSFSLDDIVSFESFLHKHTGLSHLVVQIRKLHLFSLSPSFKDQCRLMAQRMNVPRHQQLFTRQVPPTLTLDFTFAFPTTPRRPLKSKVTFDTVPTLNLDRDRREQFLPGIERLNILRFNPNCVHHRVALEMMRFPKDVHTSDTSLKSVTVRLTLPDHSVVAGSTLVYRRVATSSRDPGGNADTHTLRRTRENVRLAIWGHPDLSRSKNIQVLPSNFFRPTPVSGECEP